MIKLIVAMDENRLIGSNEHRSGMPWHNQEDLTHFKQTTLHHTILMGRKTFEKIGRVLPDRRTIVLTNNKKWYRENVEVCFSLAELLKKYRQSNDILYICGGADVYQQTMPFCDELLISCIPGKYSGESYFPKIDEALFYCFEEIQYKSFVLKRYVRRK